ncbi:MAG: hypothetical protein JW854_01715 [Actinobacteria bacterium]|nr:hypothetical protein [Actinomycetota bacterium]
MLAYEFPPMGGIAAVRISKYVKYLPDFRWEPVVITVDNAPTNIPDPGLLEEVPPGLEIHHTFSLEPTRLVRVVRKLARAGRGEKVVEAGKAAYSFTGLPFGLLTKVKGLFIPDEKIGWLPFALASSLHAIREGGAEAIFSSSPPVTAHLVAMACKKMTGLPWICEFRDPWVDNPHYDPVTGMHRRIIRTIEGAIARSCDALVYAAPGIGEGFKSRYGEEIGAKGHLITNGFDPDDFPGRIALDPECSFSWIGSVYKDLYPGSFMAAVKKLLQSGLAAQDELVVRFIGTFDLESLRSLEESGLHDEVEVTGFLTHRECIERMRSSRVLLLQLADGKMSEILYAGKMFEYFGARRPILALVGEGATKKLIEETGAGVAVNPHDVEGIEEALMGFISCFRAGDELWVDNPLREQFDREKQTGVLAAILDRVTSRSPS